MGVGDQVIFSAFLHGIAGMHNSTLQLLNSQKHSHMTLYVSTTF